MEIASNNYNSYGNQQVRSPSHIRQEAIAKDILPEPHKNKANIAQPKAVLSTALVSDATGSALLGLQETSPIEESAKYAMNTDKGNINTNLDDFFSDIPHKSDGFKGIGDLPPLLLPSAENISAISKHASERFKQMLEDYNIPSAPDKVTHGSDGKIQIPANYQYADELKQALSENPGLERELQTLNALSSHFAAFQQLAPFHEEMANANSQAAADAIIAKYSHLLHDNVNYEEISLNFSKDGSLSVTAGDKPLKLA